MPPLPSPSIPASNPFKPSPSTTTPQSPRKFTRVAVLYDIHANLPALDAALAELAHEDLDLIVIGGDVLPGPFPGETIARLRSLTVPLQFLQGNGDREVLARLRNTHYTTLPPPVEEVVRWTAAQLRPGEEHWLSGWPLTLRLSILGLGEVLFCHATPHNDTGVFTRLTPDARLASLLSTVSEPVLVCGHTHMPFDRHLGPLRILNAGSVGMPFGAPGADWLLLGPDVSFRHTSFDLNHAAAQVRQTHYPQAEEFARQVLEPPTAEHMLAILSAAESPSLDPPCP